MTYFILCLYICILCYSVSKQFEYTLYHLYTIGRYLQQIKINI